VNLIDGTTGTKSPGYFLTNTGFIDGTPVLDFQKKPVDIGKYVQTCPDWILINDAGLISQGIGKVSAAAAYAAAIANVDWNAKTVSNEKVSGATWLYTIPLNQMRALDQSGYTMLSNRGGVLSVFSDVTSASDKSDYRLLSSLMTCFDLAEAIRMIADTRYQSMYTSAEKRNAFLSDIREKARDFIKGGRLQNAVIDIASTTDQLNRGTVMVVMALHPNMEWRTTLVRMYLTPTI